MSQFTLSGYFWFSSIDRVVSILDLKYQMTHFSAYLVMLVFILKLTEWAVLLCDYNFAMKKTDRNIWNRVNNNVLKFSKKWETSRSMSHPQTFEYFAEIFCDHFYTIKEQNCKWQGWSHIVGATDAPQYTWYNMTKI